MCGSTQPGCVRSWEGRRWGIRSAAKNLLSPMLVFDWAGSFATELQKKQNILPRKNAKTCSLFRFVLATDVGIFVRRCVDVSRRRRSPRCTGSTQGLHLMNFAENAHLHLQWFVHSGSFRGSATFVNHYVGPQKGIWKLGNIMFVKENCSVFGCRW